MTTGAGAMSHTLRLDDDSDGIAIDEGSGAPVPSDALAAWLDRECRGAWRWRADTVFNVYFQFDDADDAARFKARWDAVEL